MKTTIMAGVIGFVSLLWVNSQYLSEPVDLF